MDNFELLECLRQITEQVKSMPYQKNMAIDCTIYQGKSQTRFYHIIPETNILTKNQTQKFLNPDISNKIIPERDTFDPNAKPLNIPFYKRDKLKYIPFSSPIIDPEFNC